MPLAFLPSSFFAVFPFARAAFFGMHRGSDPNAKRRSSLTLSAFLLRPRVFGVVSGAFLFLVFDTFTFPWKAWQRSSSSNDLPPVFLLPLGVNEPRKTISPGVATFRSERRTGTVFPVGRIRLS